MSLAPSFSSALIAVVPAALRSVSGSILPFSPRPADEGVRWLLIAQEDGRSGSAVELRGRDAGGQGATLDEKGDEVGRADRGSTNVDFERGHFAQQ